MFLTPCGYGRTAWNNVIWYIANIWCMHTVLLIRHWHDQAQSLFLIYFICVLLFYYIHQLCISWQKLWPANYEWDFWLKALPKCSLFWHLHEEDKCTIYRGVNCAIKSASLAHGHSRNEWLTFQLSHYSNVSVTSSSAFIILYMQFVSFLLVSTSHNFPCYPLQTGLTVDANEQQSALYL